MSWMRALGDPLGLGTASSPAVDGTSPGVLWWALPRPMAPEPMPGDQARTPVPGREEGMRALSQALGEAGGSEGLGLQGRVGGAGVGTGAQGKAPWGWPSRTRACWLCGMGLGAFLGGPPKLPRGSCLRQSLAVHWPRGAQSHPHLHLTCLLLGPIADELCSTVARSKDLGDRAARAGPPAAPSPHCLRPLLSLTPGCTPAPCRAERGVGRASASQRDPEARRRQACSGEEPQITAWPRSACAEGAPLTLPPPPAKCCHWQPRLPSQQSLLAPARSRPRPGCSVVHAPLAPPWLGRLSPGRQRR